MARGEKMASQRLDDHLLALVHAERGDLQDQNVRVFVNDQSAEKIALRVDDAKRSRAGQMPLPHRQRGANASLEKIRR